MPSTVVHCSARKRISRLCVRLTYYFLLIIAHSRDHYSRRMTLACNPNNCPASPCKCGDSCRQTTYIWFQPGRSTSRIAGFPHQALTVMGPSAFQIAILSRCQPPFQRAALVSLQGYALHSSSQESTFPSQAMDMRQYQTAQSAPGTVSRSPVSISSRPPGSQGILTAVMCQATTDGLQPLAVARTL